MFSFGVSASHDPLSLDWLQDDLLVTRNLVVGESVYGEKRMVAESADGEEKHHGDRVLRGESIRWWADKEPINIAIKMGMNLEVPFGRSVKGGGWKRLTFVEFKLQAKKGPRPAEVTKVREINLKSSLKSSESKLKYLKKRV